MGGAARSEPRFSNGPWEPTWPSDDLSRASFRRRIKRYTEDQRSDLAYPFFIFRKADGALVGECGAGQYPPRLRPGRQPRLLDGRCLCTAGLHERGSPGTVVPFAFGTLRLHRVEAACIPANVASIRLLSTKKTGFRREGFCSANTCVSTGYGRIICSTRAWRKTGRCS